MADPGETSEQTTTSGGAGAGKTLVLVVAVLALVFAVRWYRARGQEQPVTQSGSSAQTAPSTAGPESRPVAGRKLPRLVDLGSTTCIPCKKMAPILEELKREYAGRLDVQFIDVRENSNAAKQYGIKLIPTQIFYDATGQERFRNQGVISKEDILSKWKEFGVDLSGN